MDEIALRRQAAVKQQQEGTMCVSLNELANEIREFSPNEVCDDRL